MGFGSIGIWQLLIVLAIIVLLFGTKKLRGIGGDLGGAIKGFKKAVSDSDENTDKPAEQLKDKEPSATQHKESAETHKEDNKA